LPTKVKSCWEAEVKKALSSGVATQHSRITAGEVLHEVMGFRIADLLPDPVDIEPRPALSNRDIDNQTARAAFDLGHQRGYAKGTRKGHEQGYIEGSRAFEDFKSREAADAAQHMQRIVASFKGEMATLESQLASDLVSLAIDIARQVIRDELRLRPDALLPAAKEALRALGEGASRMELRVNPSDAAMLREHLEQQAVATGWKVQADPSIMPGGCRIDADTGVADATFEARWQAVMASLGRDEEPLP
jgi:flagellar assembly protein FliH